MKDIMVRLTGRQINKDNALNSDDDQIEFVTEGKAYKKGSSTYIVYEEGEMSGLENVKTTLRIGDDGEIRMKRFGRDVIMDTVMEFKKGKRFNSIYHTPYGSFEMEVLTNNVVNEIEPEKLTGSLFIDYDISLKGLSESRSMLNIELFEQEPAVPASKVC
ncbi:MAG: DUF1934 domain-containing protein [Anaerovoracaceae bacterium]